MVPRPATVTAVAARHVRTVRRDFLMRMRGPLCEVLGGATLNARVERNSTARCQVGERRADTAVSPKINGTRPAGERRKGLTTEPLPALRRLLHLVVAEGRRRQRL